MSIDSLETLLTSSDNNYFVDDDFVPPGIETDPNPNEPDKTEDPAPEPDRDSPGDDPSPDSGSDPANPDPADPDPVDPTDPPETPEGIKEYYDFLVENNMLQPDEGYTFDGTSKSLSTALEQTNINMQKSVAMGLWEQLPEDFKPLLQYGLAGGTNVEEFLKTYRNGPVDIADADLDDPDTQDYILREYYKQTTSHSDEKIDKLISLLKNKGEVEYTSEVYDAALELKDIQKSQREELTRQAILQKQENEAKAKQEKEDLFNVIDDLNLAPQRKSMIKSFIYSSQNAPSRMDSTIQSIINNREHFAQLADLLLDYDPKAGFKIEDRFTKKGKTTALNDLEKRLSDKFSDSKTKVTGSNSTSEKPNFDWNVIFSQQSE